MSRAKAPYSIVPTSPLTSIPGRRENQAMTRAYLDFADNSLESGSGRCRGKTRLMAGTIVAIVLIAAVAGTVVGVVQAQNNNDDGGSSSEQRYAREVEPEFWYDTATDELNHVLNTAYQRGVAKNVIMFIGDGMGPTSVTAGRILAGQIKGGNGEEYQLAFDRFPHTGLSKTYSVDFQTTDSAASATAYVSGVKTKQGMLGVSAKAKRGDCASSKEAHVDSIFKWFGDQGRPTGVVTTTRVTHATPASAYCHTPERKWESDARIPEGQRDCEDIASQLIKKAPFINVMMGGGRFMFKPDNRIDGRDLIQEWLDDKSAKNVSHAYVTNRQGMLNVSDDTEFLFGLFNSNHMDYEIERNKVTEPSLAEMTAKAIRLLKAHPKGGAGFFLMVEGGRIDHGHHNSNAMRALHEVVSLSDAVETAVNMTDVRDTLVVVTADHSHVMSIAGYPKRGNPILAKATLDKDVLNDYVVDKMPYTTLLYGNGPGYRSPRQNITDVDTEDKDYINQSAVPIPHETHGGEDVAIYARGPQAFLYNGVHEQNYIPMLMAYASCVGPFAEGHKPCARQANDNPVKN